MSMGNGPRQITSCWLSSCRSDSAIIRLNDRAACRGRSIARYSSGLSLFATGSPRKPPVLNPVCDQHGGAAPQVRRRAAERLVMTADQAAQMLVNMMADTEVPFGIRAKIAQDLLD